MNFDKLREEFSHVASFLKWDNSEIKNGLVKNFNEKDVNTSAIYLAMNPRGSNQEIIDIYKNNSPEEIYKKTDLQAWHFVHNIPNGPFNNKNDISLLNRHITNSKLEGAYFTDFFKISPDSENIDGWWSTSSKEILNYFSTIDKSKKDQILLKQLEALDREVELLGITNPKFIVMNTCYDLVKYSLKTLVNNDKFPHLAGYQIIDRIYSYKHSLSNFELDLTNQILKKVNFKSYPQNIIYSIQRNTSIIKELKDKKDLKAILSILYLAYENEDITIILNKIRDMDITSYLGEIYKSELSLINKVSTNFSKEIIRELHKNFFEIFTDNLKGYEEYDNLSYDSKIISNTLNPRLLHLIESNLQEIIYIGDINENYQVAYIYFLFTNININLDNPSPNQKYNIFYDYEAFSNVSFKRLLKDYKLDICIVFVEKNDCDDTLEIINEYYSENIHDIRTIDNHNYEIYVNTQTSSPQKFKSIKNNSELINISTIYMKLGSISNNIVRGINLNNYNLSYIFSNDTSTCTYITGKDIYNETVLQNNLYVSDEAIHTLEKYIAKSGDLIITRFQPLKIVRVKEGNNYLINESLYKITINQEIVHPGYLMAYLRSYEFEEVLNNTFKYKKNKVLTKTELEKFEIPIKELSKQEELSSKFISYLDAIKKHYLEIEKIEESIRSIKFN